MSAPSAPVRALAARVWSRRLHAEREAAQRFRVLEEALRAHGAPPHVSGLAARAATDELRHAALCRELVEHFGGHPPDDASPALSPLAPTELTDAERLSYDVVAVSCVTETLSTALLAELVRRARDPLCKRVMQSILRDEVQHSRLGWAYLAETHATGTAACVGPHLGSMLDATLGSDFLRVEAPGVVEEELAGFGQLPRAERQRVVLDTLQQVVFTGLERYGIDAALGRRWCTPSEPAAPARGGGSRPR